MNKNQLFVVAGNHKIVKMVEIGEKLYCKTSDGLFKVKEVILGTAIMCYSPCITITTEKSNCKFIKKYFELCPISNTEILAAIEESSLIEMKLIENMFTKTFIKENLLYEEGNRIGKFSLDTMINLLIYKQSVIISKGKFSNKNLEKFLMETCENENLLLIFLLLKHKENFIVGFEEWKEKNLMGDFNKYEESIEKCTWVNKEEKIKMINFLLNREKNKILI